MCLFFPQLDKEINTKLLGEKMQEAANGFDCGSLVRLSKCLQSSNKGKHCTFWLWRSSDLNQVFGAMS